MFNPLQLLFTPLSLIVLNLYIFEAMFVGLIENNLQVLLLAVCFTYMTIYRLVAIIIIVHVTVKCSSTGRYTGVLVHQALLNTNDTDVMMRVSHFAFLVKILKPKLNEYFRSLLVGALFNANTTQ